MAVIIVDYILYLHNQSLSVDSIKSIQDSEVAIHSNFKKLTVSIKLMSGYFSSLDAHTLLIVYSHVHKP